MSLDSIGATSVLASTLELLPLRHVVMALLPSRMEDTMCWEIDYRFFEEQKKAQENKVKQAQRVGVVDQLLKDANKQAEEATETSKKEIAPAK
jgi:hypothetical protein